MGSVLLAERNPPMRSAAQLRAPAGGTGTVEDSYDTREDSLWEEGEEQYQRAIVDNILKAQKDEEHSMSSLDRIDKSAEEIVPAKNNVRSSFSTNSDNATEEYQPVPGTEGNRQHFGELGDMWDSRGSPNTP